MYDLTTVSGGVSYLKDGYVDYAREVITSRALPNIYDGLKPVNRRILHILSEYPKKNVNIKSARVVGDTMTIHPHGNDAIYQALLLMTDENGSLAFPTVIGIGNCGGVHTDDPGAQMRYTEMKLHPNAEEYLGEMNGINMVPTFDSGSMEPEIFPVSFPAVLVNATSGIAVGFRSNIPSFNINDVCDLVIEYLDKGYCESVIEPDFVTGGYYVRNQKELLKLMEVGKGKIKLRGRVIIDGKQIVVTEVPYGRTIQKLIRQINSLDAPSIRNAYDTNDFDHGVGFKVDCSSKNKVDEALYTILKDTDLQYTYSADITVIQDGVPKQMGVWGIVAEWVKKRREILTREYNHRYEVLKNSFRESAAFMNVVNSYDKRMEFVRIVADSGRAAGEAYIRENFTREEVPEDLIGFVANRSLPSYHSGGKYASIYANGEAELESTAKTLGNIDGLIREQMLRIKARYGATMVRRTEVTTKDYEFLESETKSERVIDTSYCVYEVKDNFIRKVRYSTSEKTDYTIEGTASDTLVAFDNRGRLLRIYCQDLPLSGTDIGTYLPSYFGLDEGDDYRITWVGRMDGRELMLLYKDGNVGFVDTREWLGNNRNVKVLEKGISVKSAPTLGAVLTEIPEMLWVSDEDGNIGCADMSEVKHKSRTAVTRVFDLRRGSQLDSYLAIDRVNGMAVVQGYSDYFYRMKPLRAVEDFIGDVNDFVSML